MLRFHIPGRFGDALRRLGKTYEYVTYPGEAHGFVNSGDGELRLTAIHGASRFSTEWLAGNDPTWTSKRRG